MKKTTLLLTIIGAAMLCACKPVDMNKDKDTLYQVNLLQSLMQGNYDGTVTIKDLKNNGDIGIGTFDAVNGEMVVLDGTVYQVLHDGTVSIPAEDTGIPYATVTYFETDISESFSDVTSLEDLSERITRIISKEGKNSFYLIKITGNFSTMHSRSAVKQEKPYKPLAEALKTSQREFHYENIPGTVVGLYCPSYMENLNSAGFHFHFLSDDKTKGGHILALSADSLKVELDKTSKLEIDFSEAENFQSLDLSKDMSYEINAVEKAK